MFVKLLALYLIDQSWTHKNDFLKCIYEFNVSGPAVNYYLKKSIQFKMSGEVVIYKRTVCCCLCTHIGVSAGLGVGANARSNVFGHTALMNCVLAYCQTKDRTVRDGE